MKNNYEIVYLSTDGYNECTFITAESLELALTIFKSSTQDYDKILKVKELEVIPPMKLRIIEKI